MFSFLIAFASTIKRFDILFLYNLYAAIMNVSVILILNKIDSQNIYRKQIANHKET